MLNNETFDLLLKILRIFKYNIGHLILVGPAVSGKMSITQFAAKLLGKEFYYFEENCPDCCLVSKKLIIMQV